MTPPSDIPAYGTLPPHVERQWYEYYRFYWMQYVLQRMPQLLIEGTDEFININWPLMSKEYKAAVWALMTPQEREHIRNVRSKTNAP